MANDKDFVVKNGLVIGGNITVTGTVDGRDIATDGTKLDGIETGATADQTASEILSLLLTVDGASSGLDADLLDGISGGSFLRSDSAATKTSGDLTLNDNIKINIGTGNDLQIYHDGSNSYIDDAGTGVLAIRSNSIKLQKYTGEEMLQADADGAVTLYYDNSSKLATSSTGINVTGVVSSTTISTSGDAGIGGNLTVTGDLTVNGTTTTVNSTTISVDDKNIELGAVASPTDTTADGGGITLKGATDKTFNWVDATDAWTSSEHLALAAGKAIRVSGLSSGTAIITAPSAAGTPTLTLPTSTGTFALLQNNLGSFAATTSSQLAGVISDETGSGALVFAVSPALTGTPTAPTASAGTNTTQIATTEFVQSAVAGNYLTKTSNYTAAAGDRILTDTSAGSFTITLPASPTAGQTVIVYDITNWETNNLTVARNGSTIEGSADDFLLDLGQIKVDFVYSGTTWQVYAAVGHAGPTGPAGSNGLDTPVATTVALAIALG